MTALSSVTLPKWGLLLSQELDLYNSRDKSIPIQSLDGLLFGDAICNRPLLLKCDIEGAELLVLRGAAKILKQLSPVLLLSVHPNLCQKFGYSITDTEDYLKGMGYEIRLLNIDSELHWLCEKK